MPSLWDSEADYVFVSYAHSDQGYVARLWPFLEMHGLRVWADESVVSGDRWVATLRDRIDHCAAVIVVMSPAAEKSEWVENELHRARQRSKPILPLLLAGEPFFGLGALHYEDVTGGRLPSVAFTATVAALVSQAASRAVYQVPAQGVPIERHSMLANGQTVALLTPDARVTWFCYPGPDSPPIFADLVGGPSAGHFSITPLDRQSAPCGAESFRGQRYLESSMTVESMWADMTVTDWLDTRRTHTGQVATSLMRIVRGSCLVRIEFAPKPRFGQTTATLAAGSNGILVRMGVQVAALYAPDIEWSMEGDVAVGVADLAKVGPLVLDLRCGTDDLDQPASTDTDELIAAGHYRYCWIRDASMSARELVRLGSLQEAEALLRWIDHRVTQTDGHPEQLRPLYTLDGRELGLEVKIATLPGHRGSQPVRIGNLADSQIQRDIFGPVVDLIAAVVEVRAAQDRRPLILEHEWNLVLAMVNAVTVGWNDPDSGIWELRQDPRHHVHSKVMCWWALIRAIAIASITQCDDADIVSWAALASIIRDDVLAKGWSEYSGSFTEAYENDHVDAATLWVGLSSMVAPDDHRFQATVHAIERQLRDGPTVYRYRWYDGLDGDPGGFHLCTTWLIEAYMLTGRGIEAHDLFGQYVNLAGPTSLMPEMYDPTQKLSLGNHPQAYSHLGLIRCAKLLD